MNKHLINLVLLIFYIFLTGFNTDNAIVPEAQILSGGPPKDGIPAILKPKFVEPGEADYITGSDVVIGVKIVSLAS